MLSQKAKYGLKAMLALARQAGPEPLLVADLARQESIPRKFLELILLQLKHQGLVQSRKGRGGGYSLLQPARAITLGRIVRILDGPLAPVPCASVTAYRKCEDCADEDTCGVRLVMKQVRDAMAGVLDHTTLAGVRPAAGHPRGRAAKAPRRGR